MLFEASRSDHTLILKVFLSRENLLVQFLKPQIPTISQKKTRFPWLLYGNKVYTDSRLFRKIVLKMSPDKDFKIL